jgi:hypothetical protein
LLEYDFASSKCTNFAFSGKQYFITKADCFMYSHYKFLYKEKQK